MPDKGLPHQDVLRILITNTSLAEWTGSELYVRDVALHLLKRGHKPFLYSPRIGKLAEILTARGIPVFRSLENLEGTPDLIHGQHHLETMTALARFPRTPAVYFCHGRGPWEEAPPSHPRIVRYVAVSSPVRDHLIRRGIDPGRIAEILNFVDLERFQPRRPLPSRPERALLFSNQASAGNFGKTVRAGCDLCGIPLDIVGIGNGNPTLLPEKLLGNYDLIFARGRAALEGLAVGAAVICCDIEGIGPMVTEANLPWLRSNNLGSAILHEPITGEVIRREIDRYDAGDAAAVSREVRSSAGAEQAVGRILDEYNLALTEWHKAGCRDEQKESLSYAAYFAWISSSIAEERAQYKADLRAVKGSAAWKIRERILGMGRISSAVRQALGWVRSARKLIRARSVLAETEPVWSDWRPGPPIDPSEWSIGQEFASDGPLLAGVVLSVSDPPGLVEAVQSLLGQSKPVEVVVVNSGGGDPAGTLLRAGISVPVISSEQVLLPGAARNQGIRATKSPFLAFLASDCTAERGWAEERLKRHLRGWPVVSSALSPWQRRNVWSWTSHVFLFARRFPGTPPGTALHFGNSYARGLFNRFGFFREDLRTGEDSEFNDRIRQRVPILWAPEVKATHRHPTSFWRLLIDQFTRGKRMAESRARIAHLHKAVVAMNAITRTPSLIRHAWKFADAGERRYVAAASLTAIPAAAAYAMGAIFARKRRPARPRIEGKNRPRLLALLVFHNEMKFLRDYFRNITPLVDGIIALDDGSTDGSGEFVKRQPSVLKLIRIPPRSPHFWDEPRNHSLCIQAALEQKADWCIAVDADERLEKNFRERAEAEIARAGKEGISAFAVKVRELWDHPERYRADGLWGRKWSARFFEARHDFETDPRPFHGHWAPLNSMQNGRYPEGNILLYHLRMIDRNDREARMKRYQKLDPARLHQPIGYDYLIEETGLRLEQITEARRYEPIWDPSLTV